MEVDQGGYGHADNNLIYYPSANSLHGVKRTHSYIIHYQLQLTMETSNIGLNVKIELFERNNYSYVNLLLCGDGVIVVYVTLLVSFSMLICYLVPSQSSLVMITTMMISFWGN